MKVAHGHEEERIYSRRFREASSSARCAGSVSSGCQRRIIGTAKLRRTLSGASVAILEAVGPSANRPRAFRSVGARHVQSFLLVPHHVTTTPTSVTCAQAAAESLRQSFAYSRTDRIGGRPFAFHRSLQRSFSIVSDRTIDPCSFRRMLGHNFC